MAVLTAIVGELTLVAACGGTPLEEQLLRRFFQASRVRDTTVVARMSEVVFEPLTDGSVQQFEITDFGQEQRLADGRTISKDVTVHAQVRMPDGQIIRKTLLVTLQRPAGTESRRWLITAIQKRS